MLRRPFLAACLMAAATTAWPSLLPTRADPGRVNCASSGVGAIGPIAGAMLDRAAGIDMTHAPYKGSGQVHADLISNQVQTHIASVPSAMPHIQSGKLRVLAATGRERAAGSCPSRPGSRTHLPTTKTSQRDSDGT